MRTSLDIAAVILLNGFRSYSIKRNKKLINISNLLMFLSVNVRFFNFHASGLGCTMGGKASSSTALLNLILSMFLRHCAPLPTLPIPDLPTIPPKQSSILTVQMYQNKFLNANMASEITKIIFSLDKAKR